MNRIISIFRDFESLFYHDIVRRKKTTPFLVFLFLLLSFAGSRLFVYFSPDRSLFIKGYHIHHFFFGVILICIAAYAALVTDRNNLKRLSAIVFGIGLGMMLDEVGLFLTCGTLEMECDYWAKVTYDVFIVVVSFFLALLYFGPFWRRMGKTFINIWKKLWRSRAKRH